MRPLLTTFLLIAVVFTGVLIAVDIALLFSRPNDPAPHLAAAEAPGDDVRLIHAFYDAANQAVGGSGEQAFSTITAPGIMLDQHGVAPQVGRSPLAAHFAALAGTGSIQFHVERIVPEARGFLVLFRIASAGASVTSHSERDSGTLWASADHLQIANGLVSEYRPGALPMLAPPPLATLRLEKIPATPVSALSRLELAPGAVMRPLDIPAIQVVVVESGFITIKGAESLRIARAGRPWQEERFDGDPSMRNDLVPGDAILVPASGLRFANTRFEPASLLSVLIASRNTLYGPKHALSDDLLVAVAMHDPKRLESPSHWASGVTSTLLAMADLPTSSTAFELSGSAATLAPGKRCVACFDLATAFVIVTNGLLDLTSDVTPNTIPTSDSQGRLLWAGDAAAIDRDSSLAFKSTGPSPVTLRIINLSASQDVATPSTP